MYNIDFLLFSLVSCGEAMILRSFFIGSTQSYGQSQTFFDTTHEWSLISFLSVIIRLGTIEF